MSRRSHGAGYRFEAPATWTTSRKGSSVSAASGVGLVEVTHFTLEKPYRVARFAQVSRELDSVAAGLAKQSSGRLVSRTTTRVAGRRTRYYRIEYGGKVEETAFVLSGPRRVPAPLQALELHSGRNLRAVLLHVRPRLVRRPRPETQRPGDPRRVDPQPCHELAQGRPPAPAGLQRHPVANDSTPQRKHWSQLPGSAASIEASTRPYPRKPVPTRNSPLPARTWHTFNQVSDPG